MAKSQTLRLQSCFIHVFFISTEVHCIQGVSGVYTSQFLDTEELKMAFRTRKVSGPFEKQAPGLTNGSLGIYVRLLVLPNSYTVEKIFPKASYYYMSLYIYSNCSQNCNLSGYVANKTIFCQVLLPTVFARLIFGHV